MRKIFVLFAGALVSGSLFAGGLVTNTNQSAAWVRLPSRNASTDVDAAYYNPAGLMNLKNGLHFSLSNQTIFQNREVTNSYAGPFGAFGLNEHTYTGDVKAPLFPSVYAVYKLDKLAFSAGFMPIGGGGGAEYSKGLPSFEMGISDLVPGLATATPAPTGYKADIYFKGSSVFFGIQGAVSYKLSDIISVAVGARYVTAKNSYSGHLQDIQLNMGGTWTPAVTVFNGIVSNLTGIIGIPTSLAPAIAGGYGSATLSDLVTAGQMTAAQKAAIEGGLLYIGVPAGNLPTMNLNTISATVTGATPTLTAKRAQAGATATLVSNKTADASQSGSGIAPFINVNISPNENLNIAIKYEMATKLELTNNTKQDLLIGYTATGDSITQFPNGEKVRNDMPAMLALGVNYKISPKLGVTVGGNYFFDKSANYGHKVDADLNPQTPSVYISNADIIKNNGMSVQGGLEYNLTDNLLVSAGYIYANLGVNSLYQSDMTFANSTQTVGGGGAYSISDKIRINLGAAYTIYKLETKTIDHIVASTPPVNIQATETYKKGTLQLGVGLDISF